MLCGDACVVKRCGQDCRPSTQRSPCITRQVMFPFDHHAAPAAELSGTILAATGSIGASTSNLIRREPSRYRVEALSANTNASALAALARELNAPFAAIADPSAYDELKSALAGT